MGKSVPKNHRGPARARTQSLMKRKKLKHERLLELLYYDPESGFFTWRRNVGKLRLLGKRAGNKTVRGYWLLCVDKIQFSAHHVAWFYMTKTWPPNELDHANGKRTDNRFVNLRLATIEQNAQNSRSRSWHGYKGIFYCRITRRWRARIKVKKQIVDLGRHAGKEAAARVYDEQAKKYYGEFAWLNFPEERVK